MEFQQDKIQTKEKDVESKDKFILSNQDDIKELKKKLRCYQRAFMKAPLQGIGSTRTFCI